MKKLMRYPEYLKREEEEQNDIYAIMTKELKERKKNQRLMSMAHDAYHFSYNGLTELSELKNKYPVGGKYRGETITNTATLRSSDLRQ